MSTATVAITASAPELRVATMKPAATSITPMALAVRIPRRTLGASMLQSGVWMVAGDAGSMTDEVEQEDGVPARVEGMTAVSVENTSQRGTPCMASRVPFDSQAAPVTAPVAAMNAPRALIAVHGIVINAPRRPTRRWSIAASARAECSSPYR